MREPRGGGRGGARPVRGGSRTNKSELSVRERAGFGGEGKMGEQWRCFLSPDTKNSLIQLRSSGGGAGPARDRDDGYLVAYHGTFVNSAGGRIAIRRHVPAPGRVWAIGGCR